MILPTTSLKESAMQIINGHLKQPIGESPIVATVVTSDTERMGCLPAIAGIRCVMLENAIYDAMQTICGSYHGAYWDFYKLSNGGFYMAPRLEQTFKLSCPNYFEAEVSANTAGVIATAMAYSELSFLKGGACFAHAYSLLNDFIFQHKEAGFIRAALD
jgi:hypothetical protein